ncbi:MAG TPA: Calx-beta domain-containing protein, partial [Verrucomicrobiota bacterium]|nr:Calx-beta domain-containing protein [Verrucomicrobiota bacterium]
NKDGSIDPTFMPGESGANESVYSIALQADGKILVVGSFTRFNDVSRNRITRLNPDGTTDLGINFGEGANGFIMALAVQTDRRIVIGGGFTEFDGKPRNALTRLHGGSIAGSGTIQFSSPYYWVNEDEPVAILTILRRGGTFGNVSVVYATTDSSAIAGSDYISQTEKVDFPPGEVMQTIRIPIINDTNVEGMETFYVYLDDATGGADIGVVPVAAVNIANDDCIVGFANVEYTVSEGAPNGFAKITVIRQGSTNGIVTVDCAAVSNIFGPNPAVPYVDFQPMTETLVFEPGVTSLVFNVYITNDFEIEMPETVLLMITNIQPTNSTFPGITNAILTIQDNDLSPGVIQFLNTNFIVVENHKEVIVTLVRTNGSSGIVSVQITSTNGTASYGLDYEAVNTTVAFADGETTKTIPIKIIDDKILETDETFYLSLSEPYGGATLGLNTNATVKIYDDDFAVSFVRFTETNYVVSEYQSNAVITVLRLGNTNSSLSVDYKAYAIKNTNDPYYIIGATATSKDFTEVSGTLTWA